jgi:hypothetical protein
MAKRMKGAMKLILIQGLSLVLISGMLAGCRIDWKDFLPLQRLNYLEDLCN